MAGYLFGLDSEESLVRCIENGAYATKLPMPRNNNTWSAPVEGTFSDYASMKEGDNVFFFIDRKIYGVGKLKNIDGDCKYLNYPSSNLPVNYEYGEVQNNLLLNTGPNSVNCRFVCFFEPSPYFFQLGIDMDEVLGSSPNKFKILRAFWKLSFIKFGDEENQAFLDIILRRNESVISNPNNETIFNSLIEERHILVQQKLRENEYSFSLAPFLNTINLENGSLRHEMAVEAALIYQLINNTGNAREVFGNWDYLTHQVIASPFKPIDYMDKMDVFGYRFVGGQRPIISKYLIVEIKKGTISRQDILQLMKYVDWVKNEYAFGEYDMIEAFLLGHSFSPDIFVSIEELSERNFIKGFRPAVPSTWNNVRLVAYRFNEENDYLSFNLV